MKTGTTLVELAVVLTLIGVATGIAIPQFAAYRDRVATDAATASTLALLATARDAAVRRATVTAVWFDTAAARIVVFAGPDTLADRPLGAVHGVTLRASRDSIAYAPNGMGYGAANTRLVLSRGGATDTLTISRLGRVRR